jgi:hypothetical protein
MTLSIAGFAPFDINVFLCSYRQLGEDSCSGSVVLSLSVGLLLRTMKTDVDNEKIRLSV